jgi:hypothetical protein
MKNLVLYSLLAIGVSFASCQSKTKKETAKAETEVACTNDCSKCVKSSETKSVANSTEGAGVYYFHGDRKCKTCKAVGEKAKEVAEKMNIQFFDINLDQEENKAVAKEFQASGSSLFIKHSKSGEIEDLTNFAFRNALNDTKAYIEKLESTLKAEM